MGWAEVTWDPQDTGPLGTRRVTLGASQIALRGEMKVSGNAARLRAA